MKKDEHPTIVPCPTCKKPVRLIHENPFRPFCCHHCKLIDLGAWADGSYRVKTEESPNSEALELERARQQSDS